MKEIRDINILAIESSCDETAAAVIHNGREVRSNVISSQIELHKLYGGVVPEIASRKHIEKINQVIEEALIGYHIHFLLSRTFLFFFQSFQCVLSHLESNGEGGI